MSLPVLGSNMSLPVLGSNMSLFLGRLLQSHIWASLRDYRVSKFQCFIAWEEELRVKFDPTPPMDDVQLILIKQRINDLSLLINDWRAKEDIKWKALSKWLTFGDHNTRFYHQMASHKHHTPPNLMDYKWIFLHFWDIVKLDLVQLFREFYFNALVSRPFHCCIHLNPQRGGCPGHQQIPAYCSSWGTVSYHPKVFVNGFGRVTQKLISPSQFAFIHILANEILNSMEISGRSYFLLKMDLKKAYDSVQWDSLFQSLSLMGFGPCSISRIRELVTKTEAWACVNGQVEPAFKLKLGLQQGRPLSPPLFNSVAEARMSSSNERMTIMCLHLSLSMGSETTFSNMMTMCFSLGKLFFHN
ncbi:uncharacterized protein LOC126410233 [Nymphaea colorata]|nr:uncharacterized protein LOC126410233 [Nymphaea colorata]